VEYDDETLRLIDRLNFENWAHFNREIVSALYYKPMNSVELYKRFKGGPSFNKMIDNGISFGVMFRFKKMGELYLSGKARRYYEEHLMED